MKNNYLTGFVTVLILIGIACAHSTYSDAQNPSIYLDRAFIELEKAIKDGAAPGAVGLVIKDEQMWIEKAIGSRQTHMIFRSSKNDEIQYIPLESPMTSDTIFDVASLTKVIATTTAVMKLVERKKINLDTPYAKYISTFAKHDKGKITIRQLLTHTSGLPAWFAFYENYINRDQIYQAIDEDIVLSNPPGKKRLYSDIGFILLGRLVEVVSGKRLDQYTKETIFKPLGMDDTGFLPPLSSRLRIAPTEFDPMRNQILRGIVHDENARSMGGVSGHAGLFSSASDLAIFAQMMLHNGKWNEKEILKPTTIRTMLRWQVSLKSIRNGSEFLEHRNQMLGWWGMDSKKTIDKTGGLPSSKAFGHNGFTGSAIWIDPEHSAAAILLTNAVHPKRDQADKSRLYQVFYENVSKAIAGKDAVRIVKK